jgi:hypothetical protein
MSVAPTNPGQINIKRGTYNADTCTTQNDLITNQAVKPAYRKMLEFRNKRYMMTYLTSGAVGRYGINGKVDTKVPKMNESKGIGNNAYRFDVIGRIEKAATILSQVGASGANGDFSLKMQDTYLYPGQVVRFSSGYQARVMSYASGSSATGYVYNFKSVTGTAFVYATHVGSIKTCFPLFTSYSEGSLRSDSRSKHPDTYINHMTIQRKTIAITGSAKSDILWYEYADGAQIGWMYWAVEQARAQYAMENERHKKFSVSSMKNSDGSLATESKLGNDPETGLPIMIGDGWEEQVSSTNVATGSGTNGEATEDDFADLMKTMQKSSNQVQNIVWVFLTGTDGYENAQQKMVNLSGNQNITMVQNITQSSQAGGAEVEVGYNFTKFNINGNSAYFVLDPMFDDEQLFPEVGADGRSLMSSTYFAMGISTDDQPTMEILCKEANGVNRSSVEASYIGLTGSKGLVQSEVDADKVAMLKEDMLCVYNPTLCGILYKAA